MSVVGRKNTLNGAGGDLKRGEDEEPWKEKQGGSL